MRGSRKHTIIDVAKRAGVSKSTAARALSGGGEISGETRALVLEAARALGYERNHLAVSMRSGRSGMLGLVIPDIANPFFPEIIKSVESAVFSNGYSLILLNTDYDTKRAIDYVHRLIQMRVAGIILMNSEFDQSFVKEAKLRRTSIVFHDQHIVDEKMSTIILDYEVGIFEAVQHLVSLGHTDIAHIAGSHEIYSAIIRENAFKAAVKKFIRGAGKPRIFEGDFRFEGGRHAARKILSEKKKPTGVVVANDMMALGAMQEFKAAGLSIPGDISVIGFDDISFASLSEPALTTVCSPRVEIGRRAVEALLLTVDRPHQQGVEIKIPTYLIKRSSTAPPRQKA